MKPKLLPILLVLVIGALTAAACGGEDEGSGGGAGAPADNATTEMAPPADTTTEEDSGSGGGAGEPIEVPADASGQLKFQKESVTAKAGEVTLVMPNPSSIPHAIGIRADGEEKSGETVDKGGTSEVSMELKPGEYEFFCPVPGHEPAGMKGTLTVE